MKIVHQIILLFVIYQYSLYPISFIPFVQFNIEIFTNQLIGIHTTKVNYTIKIFHILKHV